MKQRTLVELIIDRVGNVNVFNLIKEDDIALHGDYISVVDDEWIEEYIDTINRHYQVILSDVAGNFSSSERLNELEQIGYEFYRQFIPETIREYLKKTRHRYLYIRPDKNLARIPWELLYDGKKFLNQLFFLGRGAKYDYTPRGRRLPSYPIRMLIIVDPTGTLKWAPIEAEELTNNLMKKFSSSELVIDIVSDPELNRLKLINRIRENDMVHFIGHSVDDENDSDNSGWKMGQGKLLKTGEILKSNISPALVFSHSCKSAGSIARAFMGSGVRHFIGCRHDVLETKNVIDFASLFYSLVFAGNTIGKAFHTATVKNKQSHLLSFNYVLYSNPKQPVLSFEGESGKKSFLKGEDVIRLFPYPIALAYRDFLIAERKIDNKTAFEKLSGLLFEIIRFFSFFIIAELKNHSLLTRKMCEMINETEIFTWKEFLYNGLSELINLRQELEIPQIASIFYLQKENIEKCLTWIKEYQGNGLHPEESPELIVVYEYLLEQILLDLEFITYYEFYHFLDDGIDNVYKIISFKGIEKKELEVEMAGIFNFGNTIIYDSIEAQMIFDLSSFVEFNREKMEFSINIEKFIRK